jgi:hypothetical protein
MTAHFELATRNALNESPEGSSFWLLPSELYVSEE